MDDEIKCSSRAMPPIKMQNAALVAESIGNTGISGKMDRGGGVIEQHPAHTGKIMHNGRTLTGCNLFPIQCKP